MDFKNELFKIRSNINEYLNFDNIDYETLCERLNVAEDQCFHFYIKGKNKGTWCQNKRDVDGRLIRCNKHCQKHKFIRSFKNANFYVKDI